MKKIILFVFCLLSSVFVHAQSCTPTTSGNAFICQGGTAKLWASGATSYTWMPGNQTADTIYVSPLATTDYTLTAQTGTCVATATVTVIVITNPTITVNNAQICIGASATLTASGATTYSWSPASGLSATSGSTVIANPSSTTVYTVIGTVGTCTATTTSTVTVNPLPVVTATGATVCVGNTINLSSAGANTYTWSGPNSFSSNQQNPSLSNANSSMGGSYTVTGTDPNGCSSTATATVIVNPSPVVYAGSNSPVCVNQNVNLSSNGGAFYSWTGPNNFTSSQQNPTVTAVTAADNGTYTVVAIALTGCSATATVMVTVNPLPNVIATNNSPVCPSDNIDLSCNNSGVTYSWAGPNSFTSNQQNPLISNAAQNMAGSYVVVVTDANGCSSGAVTNVTVSPTPSLVPVSDYTICAGNTFPGVTFSTTPTGTISTFAWTCSDPSTGIPSSGFGNIFSFVAQNSSQGTIVDTINVSCSLDGCGGIPAMFTISVLNCSGVEYGSPRILFDVSPNPSQGSVQLEISESARIELLDAVGKVIHEQRLEPGTHFLSLPEDKGFYQLRAVFDSGKSTSLRLIKQ